MGAFRGEPIHRGLAMYPHRARGGILPIRQIFLTAMQVSTWLNDIKEKISACGQECSLNIDLGYIKVGDVADSKCLIEDVFGDGEAYRAVGYLLMDSPSPATDTQLSHVFIHHRTGWCSPAVGDMSTQGMSAVLIKLEVDYLPNHIDIPIKVKE
uniref:Uncharacterized protein n=1 Tax=Magallana gigas TaxID=29159 RepID=K1PQA2_MAGGI